MNELAITLKMLREGKNMTIKELAEKSKVGNGTIGDIESGKNKSTVKTLEKLSKAMSLNSEERNLLFSTVIPADISRNLKKLTSREKSQLEEVMSTAQHFFNDENVTEDDKKKLYDSLQELYFDAKSKNKRKK